MKLSLDFIHIVAIFSQQVKLSVPNFPQDPSKGNHEIAFEKTIFIEQSDFKEVRLMLKNMSNHPYSTQM